MYDTTFISEFKSSVKSISFINNDKTIPLKVIVRDDDLLGFDICIL